jgi:hypothetical protein
MQNLTLIVDRIAMTAVTAALLAALPVSVFMFAAPSL